MSHRRDSHLGGLHHQQALPQAERLPAAQADQPPHSPDTMRSGTSQSVTVYWWSR